MITTLEEFQVPLWYTLPLLVLLVIALATPIWNDLWHIFRVWQDERNKHGED